MPNLLVAELFIRNQHKRLTRAGVLKWSAVVASAAVAAVFVYAIGVVSTTDTGKYGQHLVQLIAGWWTGR